MKTLLNNISLRTAVCFTVLLSFLSLPQSRANDKSILLKDWHHTNAMLASLVAGDYDSFCKHGAPELSQNVPKERFEALAAELRPRLLQGYRLFEKGTLGRYPEATILWVLELRREGPNGPEEILLAMPKPNNGEATDFRILR